MEILIIFDRPLAQLSECKDCIGTPSSFSEAKLGVTEEMFCFRVVVWASLRRCSVLAFVLESFISSQMHSIASVSRSNLRLTLFSIDLWTYRARPVCKGSHCRDAEQ